MDIDPECSFMKRDLGLLFGVQGHGFIPQVRYRLEAAFVGVVRGSELDLRVVFVFRFS